MTIKIFNKLHFLTKTQFDALTTKSSNDLYLVKKEYASTISDISESIPAVVVLASYSSSSWYRKYSDGWIEQGGLLTVSTSAAVSITYPLTFVNVPIKFQCQPYGQQTNTDLNSTDLNYLATCVNITVTGFTLRNYDSDYAYWRLGQVSWKACGY